MTKKFYSAEIITIFLLLEFIFILLVSSYPTQDITGHYSLLQDNKILNDNRPLNNDILIMFHNTIPSLGVFQKYMIKKYTNFPVIRIEFPNLTFKNKFFTTFKDKIHKAETNRILTNLLHDIPTKTHRINKVSSPSIRDSTSANFVHQLGIKGERTKIGIIDDGITNNTQIFGTRLRGWNVFVNKDNDYSKDIFDPRTFDGHGTRVADYAAGSTTGIAPEAKIYSAKIIHDYSTAGAGGGGGEETTAGILDAIDYLANNSVDVVNLSVGQYHNLPSGLRDEVINYVSISENIVFTVSVGNSGTSLGDRGTLNNPSTALQCISVTASDLDGKKITDFASNGPKVDYSLKPDIVAPGYYTSYQFGTSYSAPIIAGGAALLIDYLKSQNISYSAATIKAALLAGAKSIGYPVWREGAGFINITRSWEILQASSFSDALEITYLHPSKLPFDPYEVLFPGSSVVFNLTIINGRNSTIEIKPSENLIPFISIPHQNFDVMSASLLLPINFTIPYNTSPQIITGNVTINKQVLEIEFEVREALAHVLFDESLNRIVRHGILTDAYEIQGDTSNTIGMYAAFARYLAYDNNYSITPHIKGDLTLSRLLNYDVLILANPFSLATDKYMDWVENPGTQYITCSATTIKSIQEFVKLGGGLLVINSIGNNYNITKLNELISPFDIQMTSHSSGLSGYRVFQSDITNHSLNFTENVESFPFWGNFIQTSGDLTHKIAILQGNTTLASYECPNGGRVLIFGSDLIFDNIGFSEFSYGGNMERDRLLAFNSVAWLAEGDFIDLEDSPELQVPLIFGLGVTIVGIAVIVAFVFRNSIRKYV